MWNNIFEYEFARMPGADSDELSSFIETWNRSLTEQEMKEIRDRQRNPFLDMRKPPESGEYPILVAHSGNLDYEASTLAADSFNRLCTERGEIQL